MQTFKYQLNTDKNCADYYAYVTSVYYWQRTWNTDKHWTACSVFANALTVLPMPTLFATDRDLQVQTNIILTVSLMLTLFTLEEIQNS